MSNSTDKRFVRVYKQTGWSSYHYIWVDRETRVQYLVSVSGQGCGLTPLIGPDGKPLLYTESLDDEE